MIAAWAFDRRISKETQLRLFLNRAYLGTIDGKGILGFPAAAMAFFGKTVQDLSDKEYYGLLAMLDAPNKYHVLRKSEDNAARVRIIEELVEHACAPECFHGDHPTPCKSQVPWR